jgi:hypothetical protein
MTKAIYRFTRRDWLAASVAFISRLVSIAALSIGRHHIHRIRIFERFSALQASHQSPSLDGRSSFLQTSRGTFTVPSSRLIQTLIYSFQALDPERRCIQISERVIAVNRGVCPMW